MRSSALVKRSFITVVKDKKTHDYNYRRCDSFSMRSSALVKRSFNAVVKDKKHMIIITADATLFRCVLPRWSNVRSTQ
jgi:hypothetical protein